MTYYDAYLNQVDSTEDSFEVPIKAESTNLSIKFKWDTTLQEQYDEYYKGIVKSAYSDPLVGNGEVNRDYNYVDYYLSIGDNISEWLEEQVVLPQSIKDLEEAEQITAIQANITLATEIKKVLDLYTEMLVWYLEITYGNETFTGKLIKGSIYTNTENTLSVEVDSLLDKDITVRDNIIYTDLVIGVA